ncbi:MAG: carboxypeptidase-like regulatory domain-containing protein [Bacteroidota bacterium]
MLNPSSYLLLLLFFSTPLTAQQHACLQGTISDREFGDTLIYAQINVFKDQQPLSSHYSDLEGFYRIPLQPGTYDIVVSPSGYEPVQRKQIVLKAGEVRQIDVQCTAEVVNGEVTLAQKIENIATDSLVTETARGVDQLQKSARSSFNLLKKRFGKKKKN